jgi:hypothetical protein
MILMNTFDAKLSDLFRDMFRESIYHASLWLTPLVGSVDTCPSVSDSSSQTASSILWLDVFVPLPFLLHSLFPVDLGKLSVPVPDSITIFLSLSLQPCTPWSGSVAQHTSAFGNQVLVCNPYVSVSLLVCKP